MGVKIEEVKKELKLRSFGQKGWMSNKSMACPECHRVGKFAILFIKDSGIIHCFFCDHSNSIQNYLKSIDRRDLMTYEASISINSELTPLIPEPEEEEDEEEIKEVKLPYKLQPLVNDPYLDDRGFLPEHYKNFEPSHTNSFLEKDLHDYIIFKIKQKGILASWLARSRKSYEWHSENLKRAKNNEERLVLRYRNSDGTEFDKILGGYDEITENTHTIILVEGLFDKVGVDKKLDIFENEKIRCLFTFGNKLSFNQINLLKEKKSVKFVILLYDYGTIKQSKSISLELNKYFKTMVGVIKDKNVDPGDMSFEYLHEILTSLQNPMEFYMNNLNTAI
jgi:5S rRNA maturation endonuclease (ribonuclease M5)